MGTLAVHAGQSPEPVTGAIMPPVFQTSTYVQPELGRHLGYEYARTHNPTREAYERNVAALENGAHGIAFASGLAATDTMVKLLSAGDHVVCGEGVYGGTYRLFNQVIARMGIEFSFVDSGADAIRAAVKPNTRLIHIETPTNPMMRLTDIAAAAQVAKEAGAMLSVDNTFASPYNQRPLELGADIVLHSVTKYVNGHSDMVGGMIVVRSDELHERLRFLQNAAGGVPGPWDCWLALRGTKTLHLRMQAHNANGQRIAEWLEAQPKVEQVYYPGLASHPQHELAKTADARLHGDDLHRAGLAGERGPLRQQHAALLPGGVAGRRGEPDRPPGDDDARLHPPRAPLRHGPHGRPRPPFLRRRGRRRSDRRPGAGPGERLSRRVHPSEIKEPLRGHAPGAVLRSGGFRRPPADPP